MRRRSLLLSLQHLLVCIFFHVLSHLGLVFLGLVQVESGRVAVQRIDRIRIREQLRQKRLEHVHQIVHGRPRLIYHVQTHRARRLVYIRVKYPIHETDRRRLERILVRQVDAHLPHSTIVRSTLRTVKSNHKFVQPTQYRHLMLRLDQLDHVRVHATFTRIRR